MVSFLHLDMEKFPQSLQAKLEERKQDNALRVLPERNGLADFSSNDYLGFSSGRQLFDAAHDYLIQNDFAQNGATGSRLISGNHSLYGVAETYIAGFHDAESALLFNSGYDANVGFFSSVPQKGDVVLYDEYIHASIRDGLRLSAAAAYKYPHNDLEALRALLARQRSNASVREIYVATESVFSMDGDTPDLGLLCSLSDEYSARVVVDEAHALGVFGSRGEGLIQAAGLQERVFARIMTFGKGLGCHGAAILGVPELTSYLTNFARSLIYTTALPPHSLATILIAYQHLAATPEREKLQKIIRFFREEIKRLDLENAFVDSTSAIHCAIVPGNENARRTASLLQEKGFGVKAILSPTVPAGSERLRFCLHSFTTRAEITAVLEGLATILRL